MADGIGVRFFSMADGVCRGIRILKKVRKKFKSDVEASDMSSGGKKNQGGDAWKDNEMNFYGCNILKRTLCN